MVGRAVKWWFPARYFGVHHKNTRLAEWKRSQSPGALEAWKREQDQGIDRMIERQPKYESIVRLRRMRFGLTVRLADGATVVHELGRQNQQRA